MRWIVWMGLIACKGDPASIETGMEETSVCTGLPEAACAEVEDCTAVMGTPCGGTMQFAGCATAPGGVLTCTDAETGGVPPDEPNDCWLFVNSCLPDGWDSCTEACI